MILKLIWEQFAANANDSVIFSRIGERKGKSSYVLPALHYFDEEISLMLFKDVQRQI